MGVPDHPHRYATLRPSIERALGGIDTVELAYRTERDTEHTLGARFQGSSLTELNSSVI